MAQPTPTTPTATGTEALVEAVTQPLHEARAPVSEWIV
jgi:hypothetical protein